MKNIITIITLSLAFSLVVAQQPSGKLSALAFGDIYYYAQSDSAFKTLENTVTGGKKGETGLTLRRIYLTYDAKLSPKIETRIRLEANDKTTGSGYIMAFVKDAYVKYTYLKSHSVQVGIIPTPAYEISEAHWNHRYIEKMILDLRKIVSSRDFGIAFRGNIDTAGIVKYWIMIGENAGVKPGTDNYKRYYGHIEINPIKNLCLTAYADINEKKSIRNPYDTLGPNISTTENTFALFAGYLFAMNLNFGIEGYISIAKHGYNNGHNMADRTGTGFTIFTGYRINEKYSLIARYDYFDLNTDRNAQGDSRQLFIGGFTWKPDRNFLLTPNIMYETYESARGVDYKSSVNLRLTFFYKF